ncbi:MAG: VOC family protein [Nocardioides sp.]|uniref:VOC family protein n=1 Tax=Nocardioides sp. TaxID=35761 RepID=UPI003266BF6D
MSTVFGPVRQLGYVVPDLGAALDHWVGHWGLGPFHVVDELVLEDFELDGMPTRPVTLSIALANSGTVQIELIQQLDDAPSLFQRFLARTGGGLQHWATWPGDYDATLEAAAGRGLVVGQSGRTARGRFAYLSDPLLPDTAVEIAESSTERMRSFGLIADSADGWDGTDPIRRGLP